MSRYVLFCGTAIYSSSVRTVHLTSHLQGTATELLKIYWICRMWGSTPIELAFIGPNPDHETGFTVMMGILLFNK